VLPRWQGGVTTIALAVVTIGLVITDVTMRTMRRFWEGHPLTVDIVAGLLVLGLTVLVVDQVLTRRQMADRSRVVAAQAGIVVAQARRTVTAIRSAANGTGEESAASDEMRTYFVMLLVGAPVLIESPVARRFLEQAQHLAGEMARVRPSHNRGVRRDRGSGDLDSAVEGLRAAAAPLLAVLNADERAVVTDASS
jgi:hypothetical protein